MFGTNRVGKKDWERNGDLVVNSIFHTIQGEGPRSGQPAVFIRLAGCNLRCWFCDTEFDSGTAMTYGDIEREISQITLKFPGTLLCVITGGEPFRQNFVPALDMLFGYFQWVQIETSGTLWMSEKDEVAFIQHSQTGRLEVVVSPKTRSIDNRLRPFITAWKYIVRAHESQFFEGIPVTDTQSTGKRVLLASPSLRSRTDRLQVYVQPCDEGDVAKNKANLEEAKRIAMTHGYKLSMQVHKLADLP